MNRVSAKISAESKKFWNMIGFLKKSRFFFAKLRDQFKILRSFRKKVFDIWPSVANFRM